jgi:hypothetical protein
VSPMANGWADSPGIYTREQVAGWKNVVDAVHAEGGTIACQLWYIGRAGHSTYMPDGGPVVSASDVPIDPKHDGVWGADFKKHPHETPSPLTLEQIETLIEEYGVAAANAKEAGFDGIEVHAGNGYLLDQARSMYCIMRRAVPRVALRFFLEDFSHFPAGVCFSPRATPRFQSPLYPMTPFKTRPYDAFQNTSTDAPANSAQKTSPRAGRLTRSSFSRPRTRGTTSTAATSTGGSPCSKRSSRSAWRRRSPRPGSACGSPPTASSTAWEARTTTTRSCTTPNDSRR